MVTRTVEEGDGRRVVLAGVGGDSDEVWKSAMGADRLGKSTVCGRSGRHGIIKRGGRGKKKIR